ncbi:MAG: ABC transporter ATP-binding protein, partial [Patescibacteria group bacterium]
MTRDKNYAFTRQTLKIFWQHAKKYPWPVLILSVGVVTFIGFQNFTPILYRNLVNLLAQGNQAEILAGGVKIVLLILFLNFLKLIFWRSSNFVNNFFQSRVMADLMNTCYQYLQRHSLGFFSSNFVGSLVTRVKRYERSFETITDQIYFDLGRSLLEAGGILIVLLVIHPFFGLIMLGWCSAFFVFSYVYAKFKMPYDMKRAAADTKTTAQLADSITNNINIKLFTNYKKEDGKFFDVTNDQFELRRKSWDLGSIGDLIQALSMMILEFLIIFLAVKAWSRGELQVGDIVLLQVYVLRLTDKLWNTGKNIQRIYEALADANEMTEILLTSHEVKDDSILKKLEVKRGAVDFKDVTFSYKNRFSVLENFNFSIKPGERVAFIGPSGGGKSTIARLLLRFYDIGSGEILVDGQNVAKVTQDSLRASIALVPQDPILFHRSLMENIRYSKPEASDEEVVRAAKLAHADEFIRS